MAELKTKENDGSVRAFLDSIDDDTRRTDCERVMKIMKKVTKAQPRMWGGSIVGFGRYRYRYESGREGEWFLTGFSPRKANLTLYIMAGFDRFDELMERLGKYSTGKSCLYIKRVSDIDLAVLEELIRESVAYMKRVHG